MAVVTEVGATLRSYSVAGADVVDGFAIDEIAPAGRGQVLAPWPNRLDGGRYAFDGVQGRAAIDEPDLGNAIHGLVRWLPWALGSKTETAVSVRCVLQPQPAYPWRLGLEIEYGLGPGGLAVTTKAMNSTEGPAPFGIGFHPYVTVGVRADEVSLVLPATRRLLTDDRALPVGEEDVDGTAFDFREARTLGRTQLDTCFTGVGRGGEGLWWVSVATADRTVKVWGDHGFGYIQAYTGDTLEPASRRRRAIAIEPMTCPPNAFATGRDVIVLGPGAGWSAAWGISATASAV